MSLGKLLQNNMYCSAQWASTGGQVAYFKKIYIFFLISLVLSISLMFNYEPSLLRHPDIAPLL